MDMMQRQDLDDKDVPVCDTASLSTSPASSINPYGAIGEQLKANSQASSSVSSEEEETDGGVVLSKVNGGRDRAGSLRDLVEDSTPLETFTFVSPTRDLDSDLEKRAFVSPTKYEDVSSHMTSLSLGYDEPQPSGAAASRKVYTPLQLASLQGKQYSAYQTSPEHEPHQHMTGVQPHTYRQTYDRPPNFMLPSAQHPTYDFERATMADPTISAHFRTTMTSGLSPEKQIHQFVVPHHQRKKAAEVLPPQAGPPQPQPVLYGQQQPMSLQQRPMRPITTLSPEKEQKEYLPLLRGINQELEDLAFEHGRISIGSAGQESSDAAFLGLVTEHLGSRDAAVYMFKRTDLHAALVTSLLWQRITIRIFHQPILNKAPSRYGPSFNSAWIDETFARVGSPDDMNCRQAAMEARSRLVPEIMRAPEYQAFVKTTATQVANDIVQDLMPAWSIGSHYQVGQILTKIATKLVRLAARMRSEPKLFQFSFYSYGTQFNSAVMAKRNTDLLLQRGQDADYAVMCTVSPTVHQLEIIRGRMDAKAIYLAEVLVLSKLKATDQALQDVQMLKPVVQPPMYGRRRSRRKTGIVPYLDRPDSAFQMTN